MLYTVAYTYDMQDTNNLQSLLNAATAFGTICNKQTLRTQTQLCEENAFQMSCWDMQVNLMGLFLQNQCKVTLVSSSDVSFTLKHSEATTAFLLVASALQTQVFHYYCHVCMDRLRQRASVLLQNATSAVALGKGLGF